MFRKVSYKQVAISSVDSVDTIILYDHAARLDEIKKNCMLYNYENVFLPKNFSEKVEIIKEYNLDILFYTDIHMSENLYFLTLLLLLL